IVGLRIPGKFKVVVELEPECGPAVFKAPWNCPHRVSSPAPSHEVNGRPLVGPGLTWDSGTMERRRLSRGWRRKGNPGTVFCAALLRTPNAGICRENRFGIAPGAAGIFLAAPRLAAGGQACGATRHR